MKSAKTKSMALILSILTLLILSFSVDPTLAWLSDIPYPVNNPFIASTPLLRQGVERTTSENETYTHDVHVSQANDLVMYCRIAIVPIIEIDSSKSIYSAAVPINGIDQDYIMSVVNADTNYNNWFFASDGYLYYPYPLANGTTTTNLLQFESKLDLINKSLNIRVDFVISYIQSTPEENVERAWPAIEVSELKQWNPDGSTYTIMALRPKTTTP